MLYAQSADALVAMREARSYQDGLSLARSRLTALGDAALVEQDIRGEEGRGFHWHTHVVAVATRRPSAPVPVRASAYATGVTLYDVTVTMSWTGGDQTREVTLRTQRLGPAARN